MSDCIYALRCPVSGEIRYIGKSNDPQKRLYLHVFAAMRNYNDHQTARWLRTLQEQGVSPVLDVLIEVPAGDDWRPHERRLIAEALRSGCRLTNQTVGGEGVELLAEADEQRRRDSMRASWTDARRAKHSARQKTTWANPEIRKRRIAGLKANAATPERRAELIAASRSRSTVVIQRLQDGSKAYWSRPENRQAKNQETRARMLGGQAKAMSEKQWSDPERRKAQGERMKTMSPERRRALSEKMKEVRARIKAERTIKEL